MALAVEGSLSQVVTLTRTLLSNSAQFIARVGAADAAAAQASIYFDRVYDNAALWRKRPFAIVKISQRGANTVGDGVTVMLAAGGSVLIGFEDNANYPENHDASYQDFLNWVGQTLDELEQVSGEGDYLAFYEPDMILAPIRTERVEQNETRDFWTAAVELQWGDMESTT